MSFMSLIFLITAIVYFLFSVLCRDKISIYVRAKDMIVYDSKFYRLQLKFAIVISLILLSFSVITYNSNNADHRILLTPVIIHIGSWSLKYVARKLKYIS